MGMARGQKHDGKRRLGHPEHRHPLAADSVEHRDESVGPRLHRGTVVDRYRIGAPGAEEVGQDQATERRQPVQLAGDGGLIPQQVDRERRGRDEEQVVPAVTDDLVREMGVAVTRVERLWGGRHVTSIARRRQLNGASAQVILPAAAGRHLVSETPCSATIFVTGATDGGARARPHRVSRRHADEVNRSCSTSCRGRRSARRVQAERK